jgi:RHS repeat-associated protein
MGRVVKHQTAYFEEKLSYDPLGRLIEKSQHQSSNQATNFTYNALNQLISEEGAIPHHYTYDSLHNRLSMDGEEHTYNALNQPLDIPYDVNGCLRELDGKQFSYDVLGRLVSTTIGETQYRYQYDADNRRVSKTCFILKNGNWTEASRELYLYQAQNEIGCVVDNKITQLRLLGLGKGAENGAAIAIELNDVVYAPIHDQQGNIITLLDLKGNPIFNYTYSAFGEIDGSEGGSPWRFSSKRVDPETGLVYFGRRYYLPLQGCWTTPDPLEYEAGPNLYAYISNNPLNQFDLYGLIGIYDFDGRLELAPKNWDPSYRPEHGSPSEFIQNVLELPGRVIEFLGQECVPIPFVRDVVEFSGHVLSGKPIQEYVPSWKRDHSQILYHEGNGERNGLGQGFSNGICTWLNEMKDRLKIESEKTGGGPVHGLYLARHGFTTDCLEWLIQRCGIRTHQIQVAEKFCREFVDISDPMDELILNNHSRGALTVHIAAMNVLREPERGRISFNNFGGAHIASRNDFGNVANYIAKGDLVPLIAAPIDYL